MVVKAHTSSPLLDLHFEPFFLTMPVDLLLEASEASHKSDILSVAASVTKDQPRQMSEKEERHTSAF